MAAATVSPRPFSDRTSQYKSLFQDRQYCRGRIERNNQQLKTLFIQITATLTTSYVFTDGEQLQDDPYKELFVDFFREMRGGARLIHHTGWNLARAVCYQDITTIEYTHHDGGDYEDYTSTTYHVKEPFQEELAWLLHRCGDFNEKFLEVLKNNSKKFIEGLSLKTRDTYFSSLPIFSRAFPRCYETLQSIFTDLLACEWLQEDIHDIQDYTADTTMLDKDVALALEMNNWMLWRSASQAGFLQQVKDEQISKQHKKSWENDQDGLLVSGGLALATGNPIFIGGQLVRMFFNAIARNTDPEGEDFFVQALPTLAATGLGGVGSFSKELVARLTFDLADLYQRQKAREAGETPTKGEETGRNIAMTFTKALLTGTIHGDDERYLKEILGGLLSEAMSQLPEADETTPTGRRLLRAALTHPDVQGEFINRLFEPKPPEQTTPEEPPPIEEEQTQRELEAQEKEKQIQEQEERDRAKYEHDLEVHEQQVAHIQAVDEAIQDIKRKTGHLKYRAECLEERLEDLKKHAHKKSIFEKAKNQVKKYNEALAALDQAINHYNALTGSPERVSTPKMTKPQKPSWDDRLSSRLAAIGFESMNVNVSAPLYPTKVPQLSDRQTPQAPPPPVKPAEPTRPEPTRPITEPTPTITSTFQDLQTLQRQKMLEANMAFTSAPPPTSPSPAVDWGRGVAKAAQPPPTNIHQVRQSGIRSPEHTTSGMKHYPNVDRTQSNIPKWLRYFASGGETLDPQERIERNTQIFVAHTKALSKTFGEIADELRSFGCINAKFDQGKVTLKFDRTVSDRLDQLVSQRLPDMGHVKHFRYVEFTASIANDVMLQAFLMPFFQAQKARPLLDRALVRPEGFGRQLRAIEAMQRPAYHSGIGSPWSEFVPTQQIHRNGVIGERAVAKLAEKNVKVIKGINRSNNHQFVTWVERGQTRTTSIGEMSHAGTFYDRGGFTKAGRALQKKTDRAGSVFPKPTGTPHEVNLKGQKMLDEILNHPDKVIIKKPHMDFGEVLDIWHPKGHGARFTKDGKIMIGFLEPK
jgi:hypothetical protein